MDEARLLSLLAEVRQQEPAPQARTVLAPHPGELTFARARALALDPSGSTDAERAHLAACARCRRLADRCRRQFPHPSWWTLLDSRRNQFDSSLAAYLDNHLRDCPVCRDRCAAAASFSPAVVGLTLPAHLNGQPCESLGANSPDGRLQVDLFLEHGRATLRVGTLDSQLTVLAGRFRAPRSDAGPPRYTILRRHCQGLHGVFDGWPIPGPSGEIDIAPVDLRFLSAEDRSDLFESIRKADTATRAAWRTCLEPLAAAHPHLGPLLRAVNTSDTMVATLAETERLPRAHRARRAE